MTNLNYYSNSRIYENRIYQAINKINGSVKILNEVLEKLDTMSGFEEIKTLREKINLKINNLNSKKKKLLNNINVVNKKARELSQQ